MLIAVGVVRAISNPAPLSASKTSLRLFNAPCSAKPINPLVIASDASFFALGRSLGVHNVRLFLGSFGSCNWKRSFTRSFHAFMRGLSTGS